MTALPDVAGVVRCGLNMATGIGSPEFTRFYIKYSGTAPAVTDLNTFAASISAAWGTDLASLKSTEGGLLSVVCEDLTSPTAAVGEHVGTVSGTRAGADPQAGQCMVTSYEIARRYRGGHPRGYWPFGVAGDVATAQVWSSAFVTATNTGMAAFFAAILAAGWAAAGTLTHVNVSYYYKFLVVISPTTGRARNVPSLRVGGPITDTVTSIIARSSIGTQRRRLGFIG